MRYVNKIGIRLDMYAKSTWNRRKTLDSASRKFYERHRLGGPSAPGSFVATHQQCTDGYRQSYK